MKVRSKATVEREVDVDVSRRGGDVQEWIAWDFCSMKSLMAVEIHHRSLAEIGVNVGCF
jgi:hypothetical protein